MSTFSREEKARYHRHLILEGLGADGQAKLKAASVLVIGAGGLGSPLLMYLAAAGVGRITVVDDDAVDLSNLQRQIAHATADIGRPKAESAAETMRSLNPDISVRALRARLTAENAMELIGEHDVVADGCDNFATRYLVSDACHFARRPLVSAAVGQFSGQLSVFRPYEKGADGNPLPGYRDLLPQAPPAQTAPGAQEAGVIGPLPGVMGALQAMEVIKEITGAGVSLAGWLLLYDALETGFMKIRLTWNPDNPLTGKNPTIRDLSIHARGGGAASGAAT